MNIRNYNVQELAEIIAKRSTCNVKVGAVLYDSFGVFAWGWNHAGADGLGEHAEANAIKRANKARLRGASIVTCAIRKGKIICSLPCPDCSKLIKKNRIWDVTAYNLDKKLVTFDLWS